MNGNERLLAVFFDVGGTLGVVEQDADGALALTPFPTTPAMLAVFRNTLGLRVGLISNLPAGLSTAQFRALLDAAGLGNQVDPDCIVTNHDAGADKPDATIYRFAAQRAGVPIGACLYVGEAADEVAGALAAGMAAMLKP